MEQERMRLDEIRIRDLEVFARHGVYPEENRLGQKFLVSATLYMDTRRAGRTDDLSASVDYGQVCTLIDRCLREHTFRLLERAAEYLAEELLLCFERLEKVDIEIKKPWAPVGLPLDTVSVKISRGWHKAYLSAGSNLGDRKAYLLAAVEKLNRVRGCTVRRVSYPVETKPYGVTDQPDFLNLCMELDTLLYPGELLDVLHGIEQEEGRERVFRWGPRTLDLDIIFYDDLVWQEDDLCIPHVDMHRRAFVLEPLAGIAPYKRHPVYGKTVQEMLEELEPSARK